MTSIDPHIFRAYDIRGKAMTQVSPEACFLIGRAFGEELKKRTKKEHPSVIVGRDARTHSPLLQDALMDGLQASGASIFDIGQTPSPVCYFTICTRKADGGIHVTASHNPKEDNGLKLSVSDAEAFSGEDIQRLRSSIQKNAKAWISLPKEGAGSRTSIDGVTPYIEMLSKTFAGVGNGVSLVLDGGNGVAGPVYSEVLKRVGATVSELFIEPDGTFPNHPADPSKHSTLKDLQERVRSEKASLGFALDGDGDRLGIVDDTGAIVTADQTLLLLAKDHLSRRPGGPVVYTVSNSSLLETEVRMWGGKPVMCRVGHSFVEHAMREHGAALGGEQSGHFFCGEDYFGFDDALVAALRILSLLKREPSTSVHSLVATFPSVFQAQERRPACSDDKKASVVESAIAHFQKHYPVSTLDGARIDFGDGAWAGIRYSNTSPCLSICIEARSSKKLASVESEILSHLSTYPEVKW